MTTTIHIDDNFFSVPDHVYCNERASIPEDRATIEWLFSDENSFFKEGEAWVRVIPNTARLAGFIHPDYPKGCAYFGFWETIHDSDITNKLFEEFEAWALSRGCRTVMGPINFSTFYTYRLRLNQFDLPYSFQGEPHSPDYYLPLLHHRGYTVSQEYFTDVINTNHPMNKVPDAFMEKMNTRYSIHPLTPDVFEERFSEFTALTNQVFGHKDFYTPSILSIFDKVTKPFILKNICPKTSFFATAKDGSNIIGYVIVFPHYGPLLCRHSDMQVPLAHIDYSTHFPMLTEPTAIVKTVCVSPEDSKKGLVFMLYLATLQASRAYYSHIVMALTSTTTRKVLSPDVISDTYKYGVFSKELK